MILTIIAISILAIICAFVLDDFFIDLVWLFNNLGPQELTLNQQATLREKPQKNIAIMVANWHEEEVIHRMVSGNIKRLKYDNYHFFIGVYPNDVATMAAAEAVEKIYPNRVHVIVNPKPGPTSKGQMLNEVARNILIYENDMGVKFDVFVMHDSEDILHPLSLQVINSEMDSTDFLQIPIFSFTRPARDWVGATYMDEFAEIHTKDMMVRQVLGAAVPSAGVGTALGRQLVLSLMVQGQSQLLREDSLTEDYILGMSSAALGFRTAFCCYYVRDRDGEKDFIATREYFPNSYSSSVKQKTRWILGIVFQGRKIIPWGGSFFNRYFLYRDRRGPFNNFVTMSATALTAYVIFAYFSQGRYPSFMYEPWFIVGSMVATFGMLNRFLHRLRGVVLVSGWGAAWPLLFRWPLANFINFMATYRAVVDYQRARIRREPLKWAKTTHELPPGFGDDFTDRHPTDI